ncbi:hypothetical protein [Variovorax sp. UC122_21]|uniref:hypothetical protein n=1 Tax=Variovorax sp. UC122_21 TaxID=3374554 RepID=UPI003756FFF7
MTDTRPIEARIAVRASVAPDICALEIEARDGTPLPAFDAGHTSTCMSMASCGSTRCSAHRAQRPRAIASRC